MTRPGDSAGQASKAWDRVNHTYKRQVPQRWGPDYEPAIQAVPGDAPPRSTPTAFRSCRLGRTMHTLSKGEAFFVALALYHPAVWDVHEQHILHPFPSTHPLAEHPAHRHRPWPATSGTLKILDGLGSVRRHPQVSKPTPMGPTNVVPAAADGARKLMSPWIGDVLVFISDERGPYLVEWDVKNVSGMHGKPWAGDWKTSNSRRTAASAELRDRAYLRYMAELGIPIRRVAEDQIDPQVVYNLIRLMARNQQGLTVPQAQALEIECALQDALVSGETPARAVRRVLAGKQADKVALSVMERAIWERRLRVDLAGTILMDRPLHPERVDLLTVHADLFAR